MSTDLMEITRTAARGLAVHRRVGGPTHSCGRCKEWAEILQLVADDADDVEEQLAHGRAERLMRAGGGTDWQALAGTVYRRNVS